MISADKAAGLHIVIYCKGFAILYAKLPTFPTAVNHDLAMHIHHVTTYGLCQLQRVYTQLQSASYAYAAACLKGRACNASLGICHLYRYARRIPNIGMLFGHSCTAAVELKASCSSS